MLRLPQAVIDLVHPLDLELFRRISAIHHPAGDRVLPRLSRYANHSRLWMVIALVLAAFGGRFGKRASLRGLIAIAGASFLANLPVKLLSRRPRPELEVPLARRLARLPTSTSFPSGHSASAFAFAVGASLEKPAMAAVLAPLAAAVAYSRIYTGVHYPSDVVVGAALGAGVGFATRRLWPEVADEPAETRPAPLIPVSPIAPDGRGLTVVVNPSAGSRRDSDVPGSLRERLPGAEIIELSEHDDLVEVFKRAAESCEILGVVGGDGTVNAAATVAMEQGKPLLVVPGGTLNHFARDLGIGSIDDAMEAIENGAGREVDVSLIDGKVFLNTASIGAYVDLVEARELIEKTVGKWPAVLVALARVLREGEPVRIELDGRSVEAWMVFFGNCRYLPAGFAPSARSRLDDGLVDVRIVHSSHPFSRTRLMWAVLTGTLGASRVYEARLSTNPIKVRSHQDRLRLTRDGETFEGSTAFSVEKAGSRLVVLVSVRT